MRQVNGYAFFRFVRGFEYIEKIHIRRFCSFRHNVTSAEASWRKDRAFVPQLMCHSRPFSASSARNKPRDDRYLPEVASEEQSHCKAARPSTRKNSLRAVAAEAQRSRQSFIKGKGKNRFIDPDATTKKVTAFCAAEQYDIAAVSRLLEREGFQLDPCRTRLSHQVVHVQTSHWLPDLMVRDSTDHNKGLVGDIFIFPSGTVVAWNVPERQVLRLVKEVLPAAADGAHPHLLETEDIGYLEDPSTDFSKVIGDTIVLGTKLDHQDLEAHEDGETQRIEQSIDYQDPGADAALAKIAFSSGLARSTKLAVLESLFQAYFDSTRSIPTQLSQGTRLSFTRAFILRKTGELLNIRAQLNLYSELTDSLPDIFWDSRHDLGLEGYYDAMGRGLDVGVRIKLLNEKMNYAQEIATILRERLSEKHGTQLEWYIIILIAIEIGFQVYHFGKEYRERHDPNGTEALLRRYLEATTPSEERSIRSATTIEKS